MEPSEQPEQEAVVLGCLLNRCALTLASPINRVLRRTPTVFAQPEHLFAALSDLQTDRVVGVPGGSPAARVKVVVA